MGSPVVDGEDVTCVVDGFADYLEATDARQIETPPSYSALRENFTPLVTGHTCDVSSGQLGITADLLETAIRLVTGGGRYRKSDVNIYVGDPLTFAVEYGDTTILINGEDMDTFTLDQEPETAVDADPHDICGYSIVEDTPKMRTALRVFIDQVAPHLDCELAGYAERIGSKHVFTTAAGDRLGITNSNLKDLTTPFPATDEITGTHTVDPEIGDSHEVDVPGVPNEPGEPYRLDFDNHVVIGHRLGRQRPAKGAYCPTPSAFKMLSDGTTFRLYTYTAAIRDVTVGGDSQQRVSIERHDTPIAEYTIKAGGFTPAQRYRNILENNN